uniref:Reverse transcriptase n=1 Tax=Tanacetum cinerariifolium TaxID=118510 RepID=A0A699H527_TANCI|nr:reverse transcriptase [Tanacetum cinerariifolium]
MAGEQPKHWMKWLSLAEWWYSTNHHSAINTTPYEVVYGQIPPVHVPYVGGESKVAYKLQLSDSSQIHDVFHISQLKKCKGIVTHGGSLHACDAQGVMRIEPLSILERRIAKRGNIVVVYVLVQWTNASREDATWEPIEEIQKKISFFQYLILRTRSI